MTSRGLRLFWMVLLLPAILGTPAAAGEPQDTDGAATEKARRKSLTWLPLPVLFYRPETRVGAGAQLKFILNPPHDSPGARPSTIAPEFYYTQNRQFVAKIHADIYQKQDAYHFTVDADYRYFPDRFYGLGNTTRLADEEVFTSRSWRIRMVGEKRILPGVYAGLQYHHESWEIVESVPEGMLDSGAIVGSDRGSVSGIGIVLGYDTRDHIYFPRRGSWVRLDTRVYSSRLGGTLGFSHFSIDGRYYMPFFGKGVIALQVLLESQGGEVPFHLLASLGGGDLLRGYYTGRFRDRRLAAAQVELRMPVIWRIGVSAFLGVGEVAGHFAEMRLDQLRVSLGFGLRFLFNRKQRMWARMDLGFGSDSDGIYMEGNEAF